jgi:hypothetical protein
MKRNIKTLMASTLAATALLFAYSCTEPDDLITEDAQEGGGIVSIAGTSGKVLGVPDATTGQVTFTDNALSMTVTPMTGTVEVAQYSIVKSLNGGAEVVVEQFTDIPHTTTLTTLAQFVEGTGKAATDLRIGDVFTFRVKQTLSDGRVLYAAPAAGRYNVVVNCSSNLAGSYTYAGTWDRAETGNVAVPFGGADVITEVSPGVYSTLRSGHYTALTIDDPCPFIFSDVCGELTIAEQNLCDAYSNLIAGSGYVDAATGDLHFEYHIEFAAGNRIYTVTYTKN